jgi:ComF family protein
MPSAYARLALGFQARYQTRMGVFRSLLNAALPARCPSCSAVVEDQGAFCTPCWQGLEFITEPCCRQCGDPLPYALPGGSTCAACLAKPPPWSRARAVWRYSDAATAPILKFKHADHVEYARALAPHLVRAGAAVLDDANALLVPTPLHRWRLFWRMYNQSALLAQAVAKRTGHRLLVDALQRTRATRPQQGLSADERARNVRGAFQVNPQSAALVRGRTIVLIDDVLTTGSTADACAKALYKAGAADVRVLVLAKVVRPSQIL